MSIILWIITSLVGLLIIWAVWNLLINYISEHSRWQAKFLAGTLPDPPPNGFYGGTAILLGSLSVPWLGKSFVPSENAGFNIFTPTGAAILRVATPLYPLFRKNPEGNTDAYFFKTSVGTGFKDKQIETFKLDYGSRENPFLIRIIVDEIVETGPGEYLGKVHLKALPGYYSTIGYFGLKRKG